MYSTGSMIYEEVVYVSLLGTCWNPIRTQLVDGAVGFRKSETPIENMEISKSISHERMGLNLIT